MRIKLFSIIVLLLLIIVAIVPWLDGYLFKQQYVTMLAALSDTQKVNIKVVEYHQGWLHSTAKISISSVIPNSPPQITLDEFISHGPFAYDAESKHRVFAMAAIQGNVHFPVTIEALLLGNQPAEKGVFTLNTIASFGGRYTTHISSPVFTLPIPSVQAVWQGVRGTSIIDVANDTIKHINIDWTIGSLSVQSSHGNIQTKEISLKSQVMPDVIEGLWNGSYSIAVPEITANGMGNSITLKDFNFSNLFGVVATTFYNSKLQIYLGQFATPSFSINQSNLSLAFENLNAQALLNLLKTVRSYIQGDLTQEQYIAQYPMLLPPLIMPTTMIQEDAAINSSFGRLLANGQVGWPTGVKSIEDMVKNAKAKLDLRVSISLVNQIMGSMAAHENATTAAPAGNVAQTGEQLLLAQIDSLVKDKKIQIDIAVQLKDLVQTHLSTADFSKNLDGFVLRKEIPAAIATDLKTQYDAVSMNKTLAVQKQPATTPPESSADQMKERLNAWLKAGYITQDKDDYVTTLTYEQGVIKANGLNFSPNS